MTEHPQQILQQRHAEYDRISGGITSPLRDAAWVTFALVAVLSIVAPLSAAVEDANTVLTVARIFDTNDFQAESAAQWQWLEDRTGYTRLQDDTDVNDVNDAQDIVWGDPTSGDTKVLVTPAQRIPAGADKPLAIAGYQWSRDMKKVLIFTNAQPVWRDRTRGDYWVLDRDTDALFRLGGRAEPGQLMFAKFSPDGTHAAYVYHRDIYVQNLATRRIRRLTRSGSDTIINGTSDWVYEEELGVRDGFRWSPDGAFIAYWQFDDLDVNDYMLMNTTDSLYPALKRFPYPKAGQTNPACRVGVVRANGGRTAWIKIPGDPRNHYLQAMAWIEDSRDLVIQQLNRLQNTDRVFICTAGKRLFGAARVTRPREIFADTDPAWVNPNARPHWIEQGRAFLWLSERDGWNHIYRVERASGAVTLLSPGDYDVIQLLHVDEDAGRIYVTASPDDPARRYLYQIPLTGGPAARVTPPDSPGTHNYRISSDGQWALHTVSACGRAPCTDLVHLPDHVSRQTFEDNRKLQQALDALPACPVEFFDVPVSDTVRLPAWMIKPPDFDPRQSYPVLFYVYGEPAGQTVQDRWMGKQGLWHRMLAQQGYIVMSVDNRGTPAPLGRAWRKCIYRQVGILASADQAAAVQAAVGRWPFVDPNRIGIWGWSGGGSMTLNALFRYPDVYRAGMAVAFVSDMHYYDTIYQERYMGLPADNEEGYRNGSPITFAGQLKGDLLLVYGTGDDNCHFQNCEALINELVKHDKPFNLMVYPNRRHDLAQGKHTKRHVFELLTRTLKEALPAGPQSLP